MTTFKKIREQKIETLDMIFQEFHHETTGALHYHLASKNPENVFLVAFRTMPQDSTGVAHILEHTSLCGSKKFPVRDPFFLMLRRSLNTFMNAFTSSDWTAYPFASQNKKDFDNLLSVYLDAVFFPNLDERDFAQEGHRIELTETDNPDSPLQFKGVVFNEMKGAMSSPISQLYQKISKHLYPTTTYHYNSGGEPKNIPDLTYEQLKAFHTHHYHPSNAIFMTFGDIPAETLQQRFESGALSEFSKSDDHYSVPDEQRYDAPINATETYAHDQKKKQTYVSLAWLLGHCTDHEALMKARLLSAVLLDHSAAPLRQALETSELGSSPSPMCGLSDSEREMAFICGLEGCEPEQAEAVEKLILDTLDKVAEAGIPVEQLRAVLHQIELGQREITGGSYPYGLQLILSALPGAVHWGDPLLLLDLEPALTTLREQIEHPTFIQALIRDLLLNNTHRVRVTLVPDVGQAEKERAEEQACLNQIGQSLTDQDKAKLVKQAKALADRQEEEPDVSILPKVTLADVPNSLTEPQAELIDAAVPLHFYAQGTNGLVYQDMIFEFPNLPDQLHPYLTHYTEFLTELGCGKKDYLAMQSWQYQVTGGLSSQISMRTSLKDLSSVKTCLILSGKALSRHQSDLSEILYTTFEEVRFDELSRLKELMAHDCARFNQGIAQNGHRYAMLAANAALSPVAAYQHGQEGLKALQMMNQMMQQFDEAAQSNFSDQLQTIHKHMLTAPRQGLAIGEASMRNELLTSHERWVLKTEKQNDFQLPQTMTKLGQAWVLPTQVNFCAKSYQTVGLMHEDAAPLTVLASVLRNNFLHQAIREQGGAYGGGASHDPGLGVFQFYSYRDPRFEETLNDFDRAIEWVLKETLSNRVIEEAILGVISDIDKPGSPAGEAKKAFYNHYHGRTKAIRETYRENILSVKAKALKRVAETYLQPGLASQAILTNENGVKQAEALELTIARV